MKDKVAFISGGNSGIGLATALAFAREGSSVAIFSRRKAENKEAQYRVEAEGVRCLTFQGDVTRESDVVRAISETAETLGGLHFAFNNAGVEQVPTPLQEQSDEDYQRVMDINVKGVWLCMKYEAPLIQKSGGGCIVNTSSVAGHIGMAQFPLYIAAKHAVLGLTKSVALEYARQHVRVNAVCPGVVKTDLYDRVIGKNADMEAAIEAMHPMGRIGTPEEVASAVIYLCRDATWTTGQSLIMDGGFTIP